MIDYWGSNTTYQEMEMGRGEVAEDDSFREYYQELAAARKARLAEVNAKWANIDKKYHAYVRAQQRTIHRYRLYVHACKVMDEEYNKADVNESKREQLSAAARQALRKYEQARAIEAKKHKAYQDA